MLNLTLKNILKKVFCLTIKWHEFQVSSKTSKLKVWAMLQTRMKDVIQVPLTFH